LPTGEGHLSIDGVTLPYLPVERDLEAAGLRDVKVARDGLMIGQRICHADKMDKCEKWIETRSSHNDGSTTFSVLLRAADHTWVSDLASLQFFKQQK